MTSLEEVLTRRAQKLAEKALSHDDLACEYTIVVLSVGTERFGVQVQTLREIAKTPAIARLPGLPRWLPGMVQLRGEFIGVVHLGELFRVQSSQEGAVLAVVQGPHGCLALQTDELVGFRDIKKSDIAPALGHPVLTGEQPFAAVTTDLVAILDVERLLADGRLFVR